MNTQSIQQNYEKTPKKSHFYVVPRYSCGSPSLVDVNIALTVANDEVESYQRHIEGIYGEKQKSFAEKNGLTNIAYARWQKANKVYRLDLITGEEFQEPKRLEYEEIKSLKILQNQNKYIGLNSSEKMKMESLIFRAKIHRQKI